MRQRLVGVVDVLGAHEERDLPGLRVDDLAAVRTEAILKRGIAGIDRMVKLRGKVRERIAGIELGGARGLGLRQGDQPAPERPGLSPGAAITVPHTAQVRCSMLEKNR